MTLPLILAGCNTNQESEPVEECAQHSDLVVDIRRKYLDHDRLTEEELVALKENRNAEEEAIINAFDEFLKMDDLLDGNESYQLRKLGVCESEVDPDSWRYAWLNKWAPTIYDGWGVDLPPETRLRVLSQMDKIDISGMTAAEKQQFLKPVIDLYQQTTDGFTKDRLAIILRRVLAQANSREDIPILMDLFLLGEDYPQPINLQAGLKLMRVLRPADHDTVAQEFERVQQPHLYLRRHSFDFYAIFFLCRAKVGHTKSLELLKIGKRQALIDPVQGLDSRQKRSLEKTNELVRIYVDDQDPAQQQRYVNWAKGFRGAYNDPFSEKYQIQFCLDALVEIYQRSNDPKTVSHIDFAIKEFTNHDIAKYYDLVQEYIDDRGLREQLFMRCISHYYENKPLQAVSLNMIHELRFTENPQILIELEGLREVLIYYPELLDGVNKTIAVIKGRQFVRNLDPQVSHPTAD